MRLNKTHKEIIVEKVIAVKFPEGKFRDLLKELSNHISEQMKEKIIEGWEKYSEYMSTASTVRIYYHKEGCTSSIQIS
ncbi:MAG: hypothetical protein ACTSSP_10280, partial [Candidatus Asgardarchaeia archaeon]